MSDMRSIASMIGLFVVLGLAAAHDYWFEADAGSGEYLMYRGHRFSEHEGMLEPYTPDIIDEATCVEPGEIEGRNSFRKAYPMRMPDECAVLVIALDSGFWTLTAHGTYNTPKDRHADALDSWKALESVKLLNAWEAHMAEPLTTQLEIVPTHDPFALAPGDKLRLQVTLNGEPVAGVPVAYRGDVRGVTDREGRINIRIREHGLQIMAASLDAPFDGPEAERLLHSAVLQFDLPEQCAEDC